MKYLHNFQYFESISKINPHENLDDELYVDNSNIPGAGLGLFSKKNFEKGEIICEFSGDLIDEFEVNNRNKDGRGDYFVNMGDNLTLDSHDYDCMAKYANDAEGPKRIPGLKNNSEIILYSDDYSACIVATKSIKAGEEILVKYGSSYWDNY
jgi:SET domain-containing protein